MTEAKATADFNTPPDQPDKYIERRTEKLRQAVEALSTSTGLRQFIALRRKLEGYSFRNKILIALQRPDATFVAGFKQWQKDYGRKVRKGEKGIMILAPLAYKEKNENGKDELKIRGYRDAWLWDISQTDAIPGLEHLQPEPPKLGDVVAPDDKTALITYVQLVELAKREGVTVKTVPKLPGAKGVYNRQGKEITLAGSLEPGELLATMVHELAHAIDDIMETYGAYDAGEWTAETAAHVVLGGLGIDSLDQAAPYIAVYGGSDTGLSTILHRVGAIVDRIEKGMERDDGHNTA